MLYIVHRTVQSTLHFTPGGPVHSKASPPADLFIPKLHPRRTCSFQSFIPGGPVHSKASPPGGPVHSKAISTSLGSIRPRCNYCAKSSRSHIYHCMCSQVLIYSCVNGFSRQRARRSNIYVTAYIQFVMFCW